ncbi:unnamed protein product [Rotaria sp. Silwood1]|nr:unnamed protein product [Rotaria sp. Silwood1]
MFATLIFVLLLFVPQSIIGEPTFETIPLRFDAIIQRLRGFYQHYPDIVNDLVNTPIATIRSELLLANISFSNNQSTACERDLEILITAAVQRQLWAMKVFDAWGKPLPSGLLKGNMFWIGNYDECINPLYQINNKSFVRQPIDTQYCALQSSPINEQLVPSFGLVLGLCLPASCNRQSIVTLIQEIFKVHNLTKDYLQCSNDRSNEQNGLSSGTIAFSIVLSLLALLVLIGTIIDLVVHIIYLTPYFGHGPLYPVQQGFESTGCRNGHWWTSFLYIGNFFKSDNMCLSVTWYLFNDMQFHWIAPLALIPFVMRHKAIKAIGYIMTILFVLVSIGSILGLLLYYPSMVTHALDISSNATGPNFFDKIYVTPWCRISPYAIGLFTGFLVINMGRTYHLNSFVRLIGNLLATALALACIFSIYGDYVLVPGLSRATLITYQTLSRPAWSISIAWLIFLCSINQGGIVNRILSFSIWTPLAHNHFTYSIMSSSSNDTKIFGHVTPVWESLRTAFEENLVQGVDIGASLSVYHQDECVINRTGGWKDAKTKKEPYTTDTLQCILSVSKAVAAAAVVLCIEKGWLDYQAPVTKYWPEFGTSGKRVASPSYLLGTSEQSERHPACQFKTDKPWLDHQLNQGETIKRPDELEKEMEDPPNDVDTAITDRIHGSMIGMALGDAIGAHVEFRPRQYLVQHPVTELKGGGTWGLKKGQQSLREFERRQTEFAEEYRIPLNQLDFLSDPKLLKKFEVNCSEKGVAGNGALMRLAPVPLFFYKHPTYAVEYSGLSGLITHGDEKAGDACRYYGALIVAAVNGAERKELLDKNFYQKHEQWFGGKPLHLDIEKIAQGSYQKGGYDKGIRGKGYIVNALEAALWAFWSDNGSFRDGVLAAVNLGDDTDTTAAIYGQLAGAYYGYKNLPKEWTEEVYAKNFIQCLSKWIAYEGTNWSPQGLKTSEIASVTINKSSSKNDTNSNALPVSANNRNHQPQTPANELYARSESVATWKQSTDTTAGSRQRSHTFADTSETWKSGSNAPFEATRRKALEHGDFKLQPQRKSF